MLNRIYALGIPCCGGAFSLLLMGFPANRYFSCFLETVTNNLFSQLTYAVSVGPVERPLCFLICISFQYLRCLFDKLEARQNTFTHRCQVFFVFCPASPSVGNVIRSPFYLVVKEKAGSIS